MRECPRAGFTRDWHLELYAVIVLVVVEGEVGGSAQSQLRVRVLSLDDRSRRKDAGIDGVPSSAPDGLNDALCIVSGVPNDSSPRCILKELFRHRCFVLLAGC